MLAIKIFENAKTIIANKNATLKILPRKTTNTIATFKVMSNQSDIPNMRHAEVRCSLPWCKLPWCKLPWCKLPWCKLPWCKLPWRWLLWRLGCAPSSCWSTSELIWVLSRRAVKLRLSRRPVRVLLWYLIRMFSISDHCSCTRTTLCCRKVCSRGMSCRTGGQ